MTVHLCIASSAKKIQCNISSTYIYETIINMINKSGPNIDPCDIPLRIFVQHENLPLTVTLCLCSFFYHRELKPRNTHVTFHIGIYSG